jgi:YesN/AraC family two-component response regulator
MIQVKLRKQIRRGELTLLSACDGEEALDIIKAQHSLVDVICTDINMPRMDGITFLKQLSKDNGHIPAIVITAYNNYDKLLQAINSGASGFLGKPVNLTELELMIQQALNRQEKLKRRIESLEQDSIHAEVQMLMYKDRCDALEQRNNELEQQNQKLTQENQAITAQYEGLLTRINALETRLASGG